MNELKEIFESKKSFLIGVELVTTRGIAQQENGSRIIGFAEELSNDDKVSWLSITDNAGGNPMFAPDYLGKKIMENGKNTIIHISCKDFNRNGLESIAWKYASENFNNLLALSGDYPVEGYKGTAQPVFDIDSVGLLKMLSDMNNGLQVKGRKPGSISTLDKTNFFLGCVVSPFKSSEAEQVMQYEKLKLKIKSGAEFIIPQLGYNIRKSHELLCFLKENNISVPVFGNVYKLSPGVAQIFNESMIPGCVVSDELLARINREKKSDDKGKKFFTDFAAKQLAAFKGMGYTGAYIGGINKYDDFTAILEKADEYKSDDWKDFVVELTNPVVNEFYFYSLDKNNNLSDIKRKNSRLTEFKKSRYSKHVSLFYRFYRLFHSLFFDYKAPFFNVMKFIYKLLEKKRYKGLSKFSYFNERMIKSVLFSCKECGDCSLPDIAYLCPQSQCAKDQRNGPCGGSFKDKCEVTKTGKYCIWVKSYSRNKYFKKDEKNLLERPPVIKNNELQGTSGWANCFLLRNHNSYKAKK